MVDPYGDAGAARRGDELRGLLDRLGPVDLRAPRARAAAGHVDRRADLAERDRDPPPAAARPSCHQSDHDWIIITTADAHRRSTNALHTALESGRTGA